MTVSLNPVASLSNLYRADGSATYSQNGYTVLGAVNGPIEVQRRDELPEEAAVDVIVRPAAGVGGTRERHLESILQSTLRHIILVKNFPRTLIQITLQIITTPENDTTGFKLNQLSSSLLVLPALVQTSILTLLSAAMPLAMTMTSTLLAFMEGVELVQNPTIREMQLATSIHVLAFTSHGELLLAESEGDFNIDKWDVVFEKAQQICCGIRKATDVDAILDEDEHFDSGLTAFLSSTVVGKMTTDLKWRK